jgi:hypothetical protein
LAAELSHLSAARPPRRQQPRMVIPTPTAETPQPVMDLPQMGSSDYVRRTITLRTSGNSPDFRYEENPSDT